MPNTETSRTAALIAERLGTDLPAHVATLRASGLSWHRVSLDLYERTGVLATAETVRRWFVDGDAA